MLIAALGKKRHYIIFMVQIWTLKNRKVRYLFQGHKANQVIKPGFEPWQSGS